MKAKKLKKEVDKTIKNLCKTTRIPWHGLLTP